MPAIWDELLKYVKGIQNDIANRLLDHVAFNDAIHGFLRAPIEGREVPNGAVYSHILAEHLPHAIHFGKGEAIVLNLVS